MTNATTTDQRILNFVLWSSIVVYAIVWLVTLVISLEGAWLLSLVTSAAYAGGHAFEVVKRGHCFLSADATAFPVSLVVFSTVAVVLWGVGMTPLPGQALVLAWVSYGYAFFLGHLAALGYAWFAGTLLNYVLRVRIAAEKKDIAAEK